MKKCILMLVVFLMVLIISMISENNTKPITEDVMAVNNAKETLYFED